MKNLIILLLTLSSGLIAAQDIPEAPSDKSVVYFVRTSSLGFAVNFTYFDSATYIGKFNGMNYIRYTCNPGKHLFWAKSENRDFIEADLKAGETYFLVCSPQMGGFKAGVGLDPIDLSNPKKVNTRKKIFKLLEKDPKTFTDEQLIKGNKQQAKVISKGLERYQKEKQNNKEIKKLDDRFIFKRD